MWSRGELKQRAKNALRGTYWKAFIVSLVVSMIASGGGVGSSANFSNWDNSIGSQGNIGGFSGDNDMLAMIAIIAGIVFLIIIIVASLIRVFLGYNLEVGGRRYFIQAAQGDVNMGYLGYGFKKDRYINIIKAMLWKGFCNFLWYLLFIIPGIVKFYAYSMVPYILADNPDIGYKRALELSQQMTHGEKWRMWVLDLSFTGWYLLGAMACGLGVIFVRPYDDATHGELYLALRQKAIENNMCDYRELGLIRQLREETEIF